MYPLVLSVFVCYSFNKCIFRFWMFSFMLQHTIKWRCFHIFNIKTAVGLWLFSHWKSTGSPPEFRCFPVCRCSSLRGALELYCTSPTCALSAITAACTWWVNIGQCPHLYVSPVNVLNSSSDAKKETAKIKHLNSQTLFFSAAYNCTQSFLQRPHPYAWRWYLLDLIWFIYSALYLFIYLHQIPNADDKYFFPPLPL